MLARRALVPQVPVRLASAQLVLLRLASAQLALARRASAQQVAVWVLAHQVVAPTPVRSVVAVAPVDFVALEQAVAAAYPVAATVVAVEHLVAAAAVRPVAAMVAVVDHQAVVATAAVPVHPAAATAAVVDHQAAAATAAVPVHPAAATAAVVDHQAAAATVAVPAHPAVPTVAEASVHLTVEVAEHLVAEQILLFQSCLEAAARYPNCQGFCSRYLQRAP
ncbi:MAG: hypothetical protein GX483_06010 [Actinomycetaceae bacterium]|nr:hypothetical protein [Actinomycetaceae bacterium]